MMLSAKAEPYDFEFDPKTTALVMIDFQRDFVYPGGFGESNSKSYGSALAESIMASSCQIAVE